MTVNNLFPGLLNYSSVSFGRVGMAVIDVTFGSAAYHVAVTLSNSPIAFTYRKSRRKVDHESVENDGGIDTPSCEQLIFLAVLRGLIAS